MIANYGYSDGEGEFYISIHTDRGAECASKPCIGACPRGLLVEEEDQYGERVIAVDDSKRKKIQYECMECKPSHDRSVLPCVKTCPFEALKHSW